MTPSLEEARKYRENYQILPVIRTIDAKNHEPVEMLRILRGLTEKVFLLENTHETENGADVYKRQVLW